MHASAKKLQIPMIKLNLSLLSVRLHLGGCKFVPGANGGANGAEYWTPGE